MVKQARGPTSKSILPRSIRLEKKKKNGNQQEPCCSCINIFQVSPPCFMVMRTPLCICILLLSRSTSAGSVIDEELPTDVDSTSSSSSKKFATNGNTIVRSDTSSRDSNVPALFPHDPFQSPLELLLFPNRTKHYDEHGQIIYVDENNRALSYGTDTYTDDIAKQLQCAICAGLTACTALNTLLIQEVYYPIPGSSKDPGELGGTCQILDERGQRFASNVEGNDESIFGPDNTFRDTPTCRDLVLQYLCLWWGSDNGMYTNFCVYQEDVSNPDPAKHKIAPRPPCRSFCVQVAYVCANDPVTFDINCANILCPPTENACTPDPQLQGQALAANLGCYLPYTNNPYVDLNAGPKSVSVHKISILFASILMIIMLLIG